ncbi:MAG: 3-deoxy-D-manno-octulosonic acid kinase [Xanthomonadaceae bacterium]|jgi:3-deoxy-D-manno-octulosonic acid kinase|nr:3-deoxy-D-manno-octulosonic acid kinase [Xanthomonadaceae bacterium]
METLDSGITLTPYRTKHGVGAILYDHSQVRSASAELFAPTHWGDHARPVASGGRGSAWFVDAPFGACVLRHYRRGGLVAKFNRDRYLWRDAARTRSFAEFQLMRRLMSRGLPVPQPLAAIYLHEGLWYRAAIIIERLMSVRLLGDLATELGDEAPWKQTGQIIARFHREGLDHVDLNVHNLLFDSQGQGWVIDFDRCFLRIPETAWRERNLKRLLRSMQKTRGKASREQVLHRFGLLRSAYDRAWRKGC